MCFQVQTLVAFGERFQSPFTHLGLFLCRSFTWLGTNGSAQGKQKLKNSARKQGTQYPCREHILIPASTELNITVGGPQNLVRRS